MSQGFAYILRRTIVTGLFLGLAACSTAQPTAAPVIIASPSPAAFSTQAAAPLNPTLSLPLPLTGTPVGVPAAGGISSTGAVNAPSTAAVPLTETPIGTPGSSASSTPPALKLINPRTVILTRNFSNPDDILLAPDGSLLVSDIGDGTVKQVNPDGSVKVVVSGLSVPEGIVMLPDGSLVIAEQGKNRLVLFDPATQTLTLFVKLRNQTGQDGVDGIALDSRVKGSESIIIPDSPNGVIWRSSLDGKKLTKIASGFKRPTGAWVDPDGSILVTDENGGALKRIHPDGLIDNLAELPVPDDVIEDSAGNIFVATLGDDAVHVIPAATQQDSILKSGLAGPQGLAFDSAGNLVVIEASHRQLVLLYIR